MQSPERIRAYPVAKELAVSIYDLTRQFPRDERFGLTAQMRRAAVSVGSNVAEGCGRAGDRALLAFVHIAIGSTNELEFQLDLAIQLGFTTGDDANASMRLLVSVRRMLTKLASRLRVTADSPRAS